VDTSAWDAPGAFGGLTPDPFRERGAGWESLLGNGVSDPFQASLVGWAEEFGAYAPMVYGQRLRDSNSSYEPGGRGLGYEPFSALPMQVIGQDIDEWFDRTHGELENYDTPIDPATGQPVPAAPGAPVPGYVGGKLTNAGGAWANADTANSYIAQAAKMFGVPENLIKSMIQRESSGNWEANNYTYTGYRNSEMLPYVGIFRNAAETRGINFDGLKGNQGLQIQAMAQIISELASTFGGFQNAAKVYFGGEAALTGVFVDENNLPSDYYFNKTMEGWNYLDGLAGTQPATSGNVAPIASGGMGSIWGNVNGPVSQEFGPTDWSNANPGMYKYAAAYGASGHTGVDIGLNVGTQLYAPVGGTVVHAGGTGYFCSPDTDPNGGCGPGMGELRLRLDNGHELILGHNSSISVQVGQRVSAGQPVAKVGSMNGGHVHVEYRVPDSGLPAGWRIVDPRGYLGAVPGYVPGLNTPGGAPAIPGQPGGYQPALSYNQKLLYAAMGKPIPEATNYGPSGWAGYLYSAMKGYR